MSDTHSTAAPGAAPLPYTLSIRFTGSGSEYFRIWIVNLLLTVVTLGIYLPWAKVRRLKYFHGNTLVGDAPLGFHGNPRQMLRGYTLVALLFVLYSVAGHFSPVAGALALLVVVALGPGLFRAGLQFRLANTSWRGLRLHFTGGLREAYGLVVPVLAMVATGFGLAMVAASQQQRPNAGLLIAVLLAVLLVQAGAAVWLLWRTKHYQHSHYALGTLQTAFSARPRQFAGLVVRTVGWSVVALVAATLVVFLIGYLSPLRPLDTPLKQAIASLAPLLAMLLVFVSISPYFATRLQNLVWNHTGSSALQFHSALQARQMLGLTLRNWLLIVLTLGLYWPFAAIAMARLRLQAVSLCTRDPSDALVAAQQTRPVTAAGDAAGDLFGLDVGL